MVFDGVVLWVVPKAGKNVRRPHLIRRATTDGQRSGIARWRTSIKIDG